MLESGRYARHAVEMRKAYGARCAAMGESLRKRAKGWAEWSRPRGGYYYWCRIKTPLSVAALAAGAAERRVSILPGAACMADEPLESFVRLSFSYAKPDEIDAGIARLAKVIRRAGDGDRVAAASVVATRPVI
jgi:DNA-binding transcriptional MocR family regulator